MNLVQHYILLTTHSRIPCQLTNILFWQSQSISMNLMYECVQVLHLALIYPRNLLFLAHEQHSKHGYGGFLLQKLLIKGSES